jgi:hypothetical protein
VKDGRSQIATVGTVRGTYRHLVFAEGFNLCSPIARQPGKSRIALWSREEASLGGVCPGQNRRWLLSPSLWDPAEALGALNISIFGCMPGRPGPVPAVPVPPPTALEVGLSNIDKVPRTKGWCSHQMRCE